MNINDVIVVEVDFFLLCSCKMFCYDHIHVQTLGLVHLRLQGN